MPRKCHPQHNRATGPPHCRGQACRSAAFSWCMPHMHLPTCREYSDDKFGISLLSISMDLCLRFAPPNSQMRICFCNEGLIH
uniref:Uncharacterized protein n=1 Tax=Anguilla anguilla TaxID=7936 RepID=A0A0E9QUB4_ANGAN